MGGASRKSKSVPLRAYYQICIRMGYRDQPPLGNQNGFWWNLPEVPLFYSHMSVWGFLLGNWNHHLLVISKVLSRSAAL